MPVCCVNNGFGHIGRLSSRIRMNEIVTDARGVAHFLKFDSVHGIWHRETTGSDNTLMVDLIGYMTNECCPGHQGQCVNPRGSPSVPTPILHPSQLTRGSE